jgi:plasmid stabilization system protein ParE
VIVDPSEQSKIDALEIARYIARNNSTAALRFLGNLEATYDMLSEHPAMGHLPIFNFVDGLETLAVKGFKYHQVFYHVLDGVIRIERVADVRRDLPALFAYMSEEG